MSRNIRVYALVGVLALLVLKLMGRTGQDQGLAMSATLPQTELADIQEVDLEGDHGQVKRLLTQTLAGSRAIICPL